MTCSSKFVNAMLLACGILAGNGCRGRAETPPPADEATPPARSGEITLDSKMLTSIKVDLFIAEALLCTKNSCIVVFESLARSYRPYGFTRPRTSCCRSCVCSGVAATCPTGSVAMCSGSCESRDTVSIVSI